MLQWVSAPKVCSENNLVPSAPQYTVNHVKLRESLSPSRSRQTAQQTLANLTVYGQLGLKPGSLFFA
jgi:hypothetical protein